MIYLAVPIAHPDPAVVKYRVDTATGIAVSLYEAGIPVFSPATHGYGFASLADRHPVHPSRSWEYWSKIDRQILTRCCTIMAVIPLLGWEESVGVGAELKAAEEERIPTCILGTSELDIDQAVVKLIGVWKAAARRQCRREITNREEIA